MRNWMLKRVALVGLAVFAGTLTLSSNALAHKGATGIVKERMDRFKDSERATKTIKQAISRSDAERVMTEAQSLLSWSREMETFFPPNTNPTPSEARDEIWLLWDDFLVAIQSFDDAAQALVDAADSGDSGTVGEAFKALTQSCKSCHGQFRQD